MDDFPTDKDRPDCVKKQLQAVKDKIKKKRKILVKGGGEVSKVFEVKTMAKSGAERMQQLQNSQDKDARDRVRQEDRRTKGRRQTKRNGTMRERRTEEENIVTREDAS